MIASFQEARIELLRDVRVVLTDVDDTLTQHGQLSAATLDAVWRLTDAGYQVVPVTGGCAGWCDHIARAWPVAGVIGENGAFRFRLDDRGRLRSDFWTSREELAVGQRSLLALARECLAQAREGRLAADQPFRLADVAIDYAQDVEPLAPETVHAIIRTFERGGAQARASSIHVNAWFGDYDKAAMAERMLTDDFGLSAAAATEQVLYVGDAPNDSPMFERFPLSVGVANIRSALPLLDTPPRWITGAAYGRGFVEVVDALLAAAACRSNASV
ncbi:MAG: HAD-IIB family hydrolase [Halofilum sp. (in: g-proteobacteria)]